jgi:hypothetical protein
MRYRKTRALKRLHGIETSLLPADDVRAHVQRLTELGWSRNALEGMTGGAISRVTFANLLNGKTAGAVERRTAALVLAIPYTLAPGPKVADNSQVPVLGAKRRVQAMLRLGWSHDNMRPLATTDTTHVARASYPILSARRWRLIDAMYQQHCMTPGPSPITANRARAAGLASPLAWDDDIDNPDATPVGDQTPSQSSGIDHVTVERILNGDYHLPSTPAEKAEVCRRWVADGRVLYQLGKATGWKIERYYRLDQGSAA